MNGIQQDEKTVPEPVVKNNECQVCGSKSILELQDFKSLPRITSDCKSFPAGGRLAICNECGSIQKFPDSVWLKEIGKIYSEYAAYHQADGFEQVILDSHTGEIRPRSDVIVEQFQKSFSLPNCGRAIDIGCGTGGTLKSLSDALTGWKVYGQDLDSRNRERLKAIPRFERLFNCEPAEIDETFDLITMIHSLEHIPNPSLALHQLNPLLNEGGLLLVQVVDTSMNPFDLPIADHLVHFTGNNLRLIVENCGYEVISVDTDWVSKELSLVARRRPRSESRSEGSDGTAIENSRKLVNAHTEWLLTMVQDARVHAEKGKKFGIFGSSICATWMAGALDDKVDFYVDEDPNRGGKIFREKSIITPQEAPEDCIIYMPLPPDIARKIWNRLTDLQNRLVLPPAIRRD